MSCQLDKMHQCGEAEEQVAGVDGEGGGEDDVGEGTAVGCQGEGEESPPARPYPPHSLERICCLHPLKQYRRMYRELQRSLYQ